MAKKKAARKKAKKTTRTTASKASRKRKRGRPIEGKGAQVISVSVERGLLNRSDKLAERMGISRSQLIARGLKAVLGEKD